MNTKFFVFTSILFLIAFFSNAQNVNQKQKLLEKRSNLEQIQATFSGNPESFDMLINEGKAGLYLTSADDYNNKYFFNQAIASGYYYKQQFDSASRHFEQAYTAAENGRLIELSTKSLGNLILIYHYMGLQHKADRAAQQLKQLLESVDTLKNKGDIYYNLGIYNQQQKSYYTIALDYFLKSAMLHKSKIDTTTIPKVKTDYAVKLMMVGEVYLQLGQPDKALQYFKEALPFSGISIPVDITCYGKLVRCYAMLADKHNAKKYYDLLHETIAKAPGNWSESVSSSLEMAGLALKEKDYATAKKYIDKADLQSKKDGKEILTSGVQIAYGDYYKALKDYAIALQYYKAAQPASVKYSKEQYASLLKSITEASIMTANINEAASYFIDYANISDSLTSQKIALNIAEMEAIFQNKNKQQQIDAQDVLLNAAAKQRLWLVFGLFLLGLVALLLLIIYRNKRKAATVLDGNNKALASLNAQLDEANKAKAKLFSIISHDLRSPINQVYQFLKLQQLNPDILNAQLKTELNDKIQNATGSLLEAMEDLLLWSKTQMSAFTATIQPVNISEIVKQSIELQQLAIDSKKITVQNKCPQNMVVQTDPYYLQTILRNLLQNAAKSAPDTSVIVISTEGENTICIENKGGAFTQTAYEHILNDKDNSKGLSGLGLKLVDELSKKAGIHIHFDSRDDKTIARAQFGR